MNKQHYLLVIFSFLVLSCNQEVQDLPKMEGTGTVFMSGALPGCGLSIHLDEGGEIVPQNYPKNIRFEHGQQVWVEYIETGKADCGAATCNITQLKTVGCLPYVDLYVMNYDSLKRDPIMLKEFRIDGDCLVLKVQYSGGCREHQIDLARMHPWCGTPPLPPPTFEIRHDAKNDACEALITKTLRFDLSPLKNENRKEKTIILQIPNLNGGSDYEELAYPDN